MFVNFSNHPSDLWTEEQTAAAHQFGEIADLPFPAVPADMDEEGILAMATEQYARISELKPDVVMCQGEFTLCYAIVQRLKRKGIRVVAACSERMTIDKGNNIRESVFVFARFRDYMGE